jgi:hypothetical protein
LTTRKLPRPNLADKQLTRFWPAIGGRGFVAQLTKVDPFVTFVGRSLLIEPTGQLTRLTRPYYPKHGNLRLDAYMGAERQEPCPNSQMIMTAHAYIA